jgi:hypothetical protein
VLKQQAGFFVGCSGRLVRGMKCNPEETDILIKTGVGACDTCGAHQPNQKALSKTRQLPCKL